MAIVKNQEIPTDQIEDGVDPEIEFKDQYRRLLSEGVPIASAPAGTELVTYTKKESRPSLRDGAGLGPTAAQTVQRENFKACIQCWNNLPNSEADLDPCGGSDTKGHRDDIEWMPGSGGTTFHNWMKDCLNFLKENPGGLFPRCVEWTACETPRTLSLQVATQGMQCGESQSVEFVEGEEGCGPYTWNNEGGGDLEYDEETGEGGATYHAPSSNSGCSQNTTISVTDACGQTATISLFTNCHGGNEPARAVFKVVDGGTWTSWCASRPGCAVVRGRSANILYDVFDCAGNVISADNLLGSLASCDGTLSLSDIVQTAAGGGLCVCSNVGEWCTGAKCNCSLLSAYVNNPFGGGPMAWPQGGDEMDLRTGAMIAGGCCPAGS